MANGIDLGLRRALRGVLVLAAATGGFLACGKTSGEVGGSGETHFLATCTSDTTCGTGLSCLCGVCTKECSDDASLQGLAGGACEPLGGACSATCGDQPVCDKSCTADGDCTGLGDGFGCRNGRCRWFPPADGGGGSGGAGGGGGGGGMSCGAGCEPLVGYPVDATRGCIDPDASAEVACVCGGNVNGFARCRVRLSDGTAWALLDGELEDASAWGDCTDTQQQAASLACDFVDCERPPVSTCSRNDFCAPGQCGGLEYDESGCRRAECTTDADCPDAERCTALQCVDVSSCSYGSDGACQCGGPAICAFGNACAPVDIAGPRGDWVSLTVDEGAGPCAPGEICTWTWTFTPDGNVVFTKQGVPGSATLEGFELDDLRRLVDGAELRLAFRDGIACDGPPTDVGVGMTLSLTTGDLQRDVTGCAISGPDGNVFQQVFQMAQRY